MDTPESYNNPRRIRCQNGATLGKISIFNLCCIRQLVFLQWSCSMQLFCASKQLKSNTVSWGLLSLQTWKSWAGVRGLYQLSVVQSKDGKPQGASWWRIVSVYKLTESQQLRQCRPRFKTEALSLMQDETIIMPWVALENHKMASIQNKTLQSMHIQKCSCIESHSNYVIFTCIRITDARNSYNNSVWGVVLFKVP